MNQVKVTVYESDYFCPSGSLIGFIKMLQEAEKKIPDEHKENAVIDVDTRLSWGDSIETSVEIYYLRPMTIDEQQAHEAKELNRFKQDRASKKAHYEELKRIFENE